jgi:hypothetical protein
MGDDHISAWSLDDIIHGQDGNDTIYGGDGNDHLYGDGGNDHLSGDAGTDTLEGGVGDDTYNVVDAEDQIIEQVSAGVDSVVSDIDYTLTGNVENLQLSEWSDAISAIGNSLANTVRGNYLDNFIDGKSGSDKMYGGDGNDVYSVDSTGDVVYEYSGGGVDAVNSSVTYTLASNVENLTLLGSSSIGGTGNSLDNYLVGNAGGNAIRGLNGNDTLQGMEGADTLTGGAGSDEYLMARTYGVDTAVENDATAGNSDAVRFLTGVSYDQLWFERPSGSNNLEISIIGTADKLIVKDWYLGAQYQTEEIRTIDGNMRLSSANVQLLVTEMAKLAKPAAGQTTLSSTYRTALEPYFAATWSTVEVQGSGAAMPGSNQGLPADSTEIVTSVGPQEGHISQVLHARTAASSGVPSQATAISGQRVARSINQPMPGGASGQTHRDISLAPAVTGGKSLPRRATRQLQARGEHELIRYYGQTERRLPDGAVASELGTLVSAMASFQPHAGHTAVAASVHDQSHQMLFAVPIA